MMDLTKRDRVHNVLRAFFDEPPVVYDTEEFIEAMAYAIAERLEIRKVNHGEDIKWITQEIHAKSP
jgi:propanediol dehydratase large subunit